MTLVYVGLPVLHDTRRFHFDKGRRWNVVEHLILQAVVGGDKTAGEIALAGKLPRRVVLEALIRLMRAGWVELRPTSSDIKFHATSRGRAISSEDELPAFTSRLVRRMSFAVDVVSGRVFRRRDLTLIWPDQWAQKVKGHAAYRIPSPAAFPTDVGSLHSLMDALFEDDERLVRVDVGDRAPADRIALFTVRNGNIESPASKAPDNIKKIILDAAKRGASTGDPSKPVIESARIADEQQAARPLRQTTIRQDDFILGGAAHESCIKTALRRARSFIIIHSTFLSSERFDALLPDLKAAAQRCRIDILWGQGLDDGGMAKSLNEAQAIESQIDVSGLSGRIFVHRYSTNSHSKLLISDDGSGNVQAVVGSCNWLYSSFQSFEASIRLRDPHLVADTLFELAELARPRDGQWADISVRAAQLGRELLRRPNLAGQTRARLLIGAEHDNCVLDARDNAVRELTVVSHRLGVTAKPGIIIPAISAVKRQPTLSVELLYGRPSGPVKQKDAHDAFWDFKEDGVKLTAVYRPRLHAKMLLWDDNNAVISSFNWLSASIHESNPRGEIGVYIEGNRTAAFLRQSIKNAREFA